MKASTIKKGRTYVFRSGVLRKVESTEKGNVYYRIIGQDGERAELKTCSLKHFAHTALARAVN